MTRTTPVISFRNNSLLTGLRKILVFPLIAVHFFQVSEGSCQSCALFPPLSEHEVNFWVTLVQTCLSMSVM